MTVKYVARPVRRRRRTGLMVAAVSASLVLAACGGSDETNTAEPGSTAVSNDMLPAVPQSLIDDAKKEGTLTLWNASTVEGYKDFYKGAFEKAYPGIKVDLFTAPGSERDTRFQNEFKAGVSKVDLFVASASGPNFSEKPAGMLQPIRPFLLPEILDKSHWVNNEIPWADEEKEYFLQGDIGVSPQIILNEDVDPSEVTSWSDLLDPKWHGKIVMNDPRESGFGFAMGIEMMYTPELGLDYLNKFFGTTGVAFNQDDRGLVESVDKGKYMIGVGPTIQEVEALREVGSKIQTVNALKADGKKVSAFISSPGILFVPNLDPLPHPNAAKLYMNWFYSRAGQQSMLDIIGENPGRTDVDKSSLPDYSVPQEDVSYMNANVAATPDNIKEMRAAVEAAVKK